MAIGGTAVGTGLNTHPEFGDRVAAELATRTGLPFVSATTSSPRWRLAPGLVAAHGGLKTLAVTLMKIANDIRWLASGPRSGLGELSIPENEPGKFNHAGQSQSDAVRGDDHALLSGDGQRCGDRHGWRCGDFELNVFKPLIAHNFLSIT